MDSLGDVKVVSRDETNTSDDVKVVKVDEKTEVISESVDPWVPPSEWVDRLLDEYTGEHEGSTETLPAGSDPDRVVAAVLTMNECESVKVLRAIISDHHQDYTFDRVQMARLKELVEGHEACGMEYGEWAYLTSKTAGMDTFSSKILLFYLKSEQVSCTTGVPTPKSER